MTSVLVSSPYVSPSKSLRQLMINVLIGLIPGTLAYIWFFGFGVLVNILLAIGFALAFEALVLQLRKKSHQTTPHRLQRGGRSLVIRALPAHAFTLVAGVHRHRLHHDCR